MPLSFAEDTSHNPEDREMFDDACRIALRVLRLQNPDLDARMREGSHGVLKAGTRFFDPADRIYVEAVIHRETLECHLSVQVIISHIITALDTADGIGEEIETMHKSPPLDKDRVNRMLHGMPEQERMNLLSPLLESAEYRLTKELENESKFSMIPHVRMGIAKFRASMLAASEIE